MTVLVVLSEHVIIAIFKNIVSRNVQMMLFVKSVKKPFLIHQLVPGHVLPKQVVDVIRRNVLIKVRAVQEECVSPQ